MSWNTGNEPVSVPTQDKAAGLQMLTQMDINTYNKTYWEHGKAHNHWWWGLEEGGSSGIWGGLANLCVCVCA